MDILEEIPDEQLLKLRELYKDFKQAPYVYSFINIALKWKKQNNDDVSLKFYTPEGNWQTDGTFIVHMQWFCYDFFVFTLDPDCKRLYDALMKTKLFDWYNKPWLFYAVHRLHLDTVNKFIKEYNLQPDHSTLTDIWAINIEEALNVNIECPPEVYIKKLSENDAEVVNEVWPHKYEGSVNYIKIFIKMNGGYGIFLKENNLLVTWILKNQMGTMGLLQTLADYKRKGYGALITKVLAKEIASEGHTPLGTVLVNNAPSQNMFKKLGYNILDQVTYIQKLK